MQPTPAPITIHRVETFQDDRNRTISAKHLVSDASPFLASQLPPILTGHGLALVNVMGPGGRPVQQQVPFEIPLPGPTIQEAFQQFDGAQEAAFRARVEAMRLEALKHGADLTQLPSAAGGSAVGGQPPPNGRRRN